MSKNNDNPRAYTFCCVCYEEHWQGLNDYLVNYVERGQIRAYYKILHSPENEDNAVHMHCVIEFWSAHTLTSVNKKIKSFCEFWRDGLMQYCSDLRSECCYIIHKYELDKKRYSIQCIDSNDKERFIMLVNSDNSNQVSSDKCFLKKAYDLIENRQDLSYSQIIRILTFDKEFKATQVNKYSSLLWRYYDDNRLITQNHNIARG